MKMVTLQKVHTLKRYNKTMIQFDLAMIVCCSGVALTVVQFSPLMEHYILTYA